MKVSHGPHGREALKGEFEGTKAIYNLTPDLVPKPIAWGTFKSRNDAHFYICKFHELDEQLPDREEFCKKLAALHQQHVSPTGKYGFPVTTYNGDLPQDNTFASTWEESFSNGLKHMFALNKERSGVSEELEFLIPDLLKKVVPRLLRPLETGGNSIKPSLVHGDLWCGNAATDKANGKPIIFDPSSFWAHNECKQIVPNRLDQQPKLEQMSSAIGVRSEIDLPKLISTRTTRISPKQPRRRTTTTATRFTHCEHRFWPILTRS